MTGPLCAEIYSWEKRGEGNSVRPAQVCDAHWVLSQLISVSELFMTERSGPAQQGEARL
jgi:hypothetical protein